MAIPFQAFTATGLVEAVVASAGRLNELLEGEDRLRLERVRVSPLDGSPARETPRAELEVDSLLLVVAPAETPIPVHAAWHPLELALGPYRVRAELPTLPGFDPDRALARPGGRFVLLGRIHLGLASSHDTREAEIDAGWVDRYAVEAVTADIDLARFFPGAGTTLLVAGQPTPS